MGKRTPAGLICFIAALLIGGSEPSYSARCSAADLTGDCRVDLADLEIFLDQWLQGSFISGTTRAYWRMEECYDAETPDISGNYHDLSLLNGAQIQTQGPVGSCLVLDGVDDYGRSDFVINPADGPMSVFAWIAGGGNRQVICGQADGSGIGREWLQIDTTGGYLISRLTDGSSVLKSTVSVTDGLWHHVGVVWDGLRRHLYVDGQKVAYDVNPLSNPLQACDGQMYVGVSKYLSSAYQWCGMIDEVRIIKGALTEEEAALLFQMPQMQPSPADLNGIDGVNLKDLVILSYEWLSGPPGEYRCIWVDSWGTGILNASQCDELIQTCRNSNINTVVVEIRKVGDAYYNSSLEPRATNISGGPSFDPLGYLIDIAHDTTGGKHYVEVHAWFVAHRIATSTNLDPQHVLRRHPEYVMLNSEGKESAAGSTKRFLDPGHPGTVEHNLAVILDCLSKYDIDGINLDYIRYPEDTGSWGYNPVSISRFNAFYGKTGTPSASDPDWSDWRRDCVTQEVKKIYVKSLMMNPDVVLTVDSVGWGWAWNDFRYSSAYALVFQDWVGWLRAGILDYNMLMGYVSNDWPRYRGWCNLSLDNDDKRGSILATGAYMQDTVQDAVDQLLWARDAGAAGLNIYDWYSEVSGNDYGQTRADFYREIKTQVFTDWVDPPDHTWKTMPLAGIFEGSLTDLGIPVDHGTVEIEGSPGTRVYTDGMGWYAIMDVLPGNYLLRFSGRASQDSVLVEVSMPSAGQIITVNADLAY